MPLVLREHQGLAERFDDAVQAIQIRLSHSTIVCIFGLYSPRSISICRCKVDGKLIRVLVRNPADFLTHLEYSLIFSNISRNNEVFFGCDDTVNLLLFTSPPSDFLDFSSAVIGRSFGRAVRS